MSAVKIDITADSQDTANAVTAAVALGLAQGGFTSVDVAGFTNVPDAPEPESLLSSLQAANPELFATPVEVSQSVLLSIEPVEEEPGEAEIVDAEEVDDAA